MRESIYLFKKGFKPIWEDRRNIHGGSWTFRVPKNIGPDVWKLVQLVAIGEELQDALETGKEDTRSSSPFRIRPNKTDFILFPLQATNSAA